MKVLVVEDDVFTQELLRVRLEALDCDVTLAADPETAVECARRERPDLVLLDLKLSSGHELGLFDGAEVLDRLREAPETRRTPVVIHSIYVRHPSDIAAWLPTADGYLMKPFKRLELLELLARFAPPGSPLAARSRPVAP